MRSVSTIDQNGGDKCPPLREDVPLVEQTMDRVMPGEGTFDLVGFLTDLHHVLTTVPLNVEVISPRLAEVPVSRAVDTAARATRDVLAEVP